MIVGIEAMRSRVKRLVGEVFFAVLGLFGEGFANRHFSARLLFRHVIMQKILRINADVPWPVHWTSQVRAAYRISKGTRCPGLALGCYLDGRNGILIGKNTWIGPHVRIISKNHDVNCYPQYQAEQPIVIGDNCWLGAGCTILPGVRLGNHVVVAAGAVVPNSFDEHDIIIAGVPARIVKKLPPYGKPDAKAMDL